MSPTTRSHSAPTSRRDRPRSVAAAVTALILLGVGLAAIPATVLPAPGAAHLLDLGTAVAATHASHVAAAAPPASSTSVKPAAAVNDTAATVALQPATSTSDPVWAQVPHSPIQVAAVNSVPRSSTPATGAAATKVRISFSTAGDTAQITVVRADGNSAAATVAIAVPDTTLSGMFGADYATRVRWQETTDTSDQSANTAAASVPTRRDTAAKTTILYPTVTSKPSALRATSTASSSTGTGTFAATNLIPSSSWQVSTQSGDFSWTYPMRTPPAAAGPAPSLGLSYDSQSVDGETGSTNNQPGVVGDGWNLSGGGFIERSYIPCALDDGPSGPVSTSGDQCWHGENASMSFSGHSGALIKDAATGIWRLQDDDNSRLEYLSGTNDGTNNGTNDRGYWRLTTTDGTQYYFGLNQLPGYTAGNPTTNSAFTAPVYGNDVQEPCHRASFAASSCTQAWRWNLDYVVDTHANAEALYYTTSTNRYGANNATSAPTYVRDGVLDHIDYGLTSSTVYAANAASDKVLFTYTGRCATTTNCDSAHPANAPDTPWDQNCTAAPCTGKTSPTFWSTSMLTTVTTQYRTGTSGYSPVDTWTLNHSFPDPGDGQSAALWLTSIDHTGTVSTATVPTTTFTGATYHNRVTNHDGLAVFDKYRIIGITTELGATVNINYSLPDCTTADVPTIQANLATNTRRCYPQWWTPQGYPPQPSVQDLFHKYVVTSTVASPGLGDAAQVTTYAYTGTPAWRYDLSPGTPAKNRTWSDYAGYDTVQVQTGDSNNATLTATNYLYYRGMDGDRAAATGGTKTAKVVGSDGASQTDSRWLAGQIREQQDLTGSGGSVLTDVITTPWASAVTANDGSRTARIVDAGDVKTSNAVAAGGVRTTEVATTYDNYGRPLTIDDSTPDAGTTCTTTTYAAVNTITWMFDYPSEIAKTAVPCASVAGASYPSAAISDVRTRYDGGADGAAPTKGEPTSADRVVSYTGSTAATAEWQTTATNTYDSLGRIKSTVDQLNRTTATAYTPATGGPLTSTTVTNPMGWTSTTTVDPAWGAVTASTDANNHTTTATYDGLGRRTAVWNPDNPPTSPDTTPSTAYAYSLPGAGNPNVVTTTKLVPGFTVVSYALFDGLGQARQTQAPSEGGGTVVTDTTYDSNGHPTYTTNPYFSALNPSANLITPTVTVPSVVRSTFDGAGRQTASILIANNKEAWRTATAYSGTDTTAVTPPDGGTPTTTVTDSRGHTTALTQWLSASPGVGTAETTTYTYDAAGRRTSMTDPTTKNVWSWGFDALGRTVTATDPDTGTTTTGYDTVDRPVTVTDSLGQTVVTDFDNADRPTGRYNGSLTGPKLAAWTYDAASKGQLDTATTYAGSTGPSGSGLGAAYSSTVNSYDAADRPTQQTVTLPAAAGALAGSYVTSATYDTSGAQTSYTDPAVGGLPAESLGYGRDILGNINGLSVWRGTTYLNGVFYDHLNRPAELVIAPELSTHRDYSYDAGTGRLSEDLVTITQDQNGVIADDTYTYDNAGNLTSDTSVRDTGAGTDPTTTQVTDTQCYRYDRLQNLTAAWTPASNSCATTPTVANPVALGGPAPYWQTWTIDPATGNRTKAVQNPTVPGGASRTDTYVHPAAGAARPHSTTRVTHADTPAGGGTPTTTADNYRFDAAGHGTTRPGQTLTWDTAGHLATVTKTANGQAQTRVYSPDGALVYQNDPVNGAVAYLGDTELHLAAGSTTVTGIRTYSVPGMGALAERVTPPRADGHTLSIVVPDIRGTNIVSVLASTGAVTERYIDPYGNGRGAKTSFPSNHFYLNAPTDPFDNLTHLGAREYDSTVGQFLSVDPVLDPRDPPQNNGFSYAHNNPTGRSDPSGLRPEGNTSDFDAGDYGTLHKSAQPGYRTTPKCATRACGNDPVSPPSRSIGSRSSQYPGYHGAPPTVVVRNFSPGYGTGFVTINAFIPGARAYNETGDDRDFDSDADPERSRVSISLDLTRGLAIFRQNPSCKIDSGECKAGVPNVGVGLDPNGNLTVSYEGFDGVEPAAKATGTSARATLVFSHDSSGNVAVRYGVRSSYPALEVYQNGKTLYQGNASLIAPYKDFPIGTISIFNTTIGQPYAVPQTGPLPPR